MIKDKILTESFAKQASYHVFSFSFFGGMEEIFGNQNFLFGNQKLVLNHQLTALLKKHNFGHKPNPNPNPNLNPNPNPKWLSNPYTHKKIVFYQMS